MLGAFALLSTSNEMIQSQGVFMKNAAKEEKEGFALENRVIIFRKREMIEKAPAQDTPC